MTKRTLLSAVGAVSLTAVIVTLSVTGPDSWGHNMLPVHFLNLDPRTAALFADEKIANDTFPPMRERYDDFLNSEKSNPIDLRDPSAIDQKVEYDPITNMYIVTEKIGEDYFRAPTYMTYSEYIKWRDEQQRKAYFDRMQGVSTGKREGVAFGDPINKFDIKTSLVDRLFGGTEVNIKPQGNINLTFAVDHQRRENPILTQRQQRITNFDFDMDIQMSAQGKIGEKLNLNFNYNTRATFDFDNQMKLRYDTKNFSEDEIIQDIQAGNVSMPLRSNLIKGAQNLFGIKTEMKFGHLRTTLLAAQQRSRQQSISIQGGSQIQQFVKYADEYDENRHFFVSHWNRGKFEPAMSCLPVPQTLFTITRMEVWITNDRLATENVRDIVALADLAEPLRVIDSSLLLPNPPALDITGNPLPDNNNNTLYPRILQDLTDNPNLRFSDQIVQRLTNPIFGYNMQQIRDFEKVRARLLNPSEYSFHDQLGFLSINLNVQPDQVVGIAVEYTYNGLPYKIGEFTSDVPNGDTLNQNVLFLKMLKPTTNNVRYPVWDLMMKNVYAIGAANVDPLEFRFDIFYEDPGKGQKRFLDQEIIPLAIRSKPLLQIFNLDNLNLQNDPGADGIFDFVPGLTINVRTGRIMFPVLEPFGEHLQKAIISSGGDSATVAARFAYPQLYDSTLFRAREFQQLNRFTLRGTYKSSTSSEISLGSFNLPQGSVRVSAGGRQLVENVDYQVDYNIGKIRILNDAILQSGQNVNVSFEDNTLFGFQNRTMLGVRLDYEFSKDLAIGGTFMNLFERPLTQKVNFGEDPINNKMYGLDLNLSKDAPWLTKLVDRLPFISTKEPSSITAQLEVAALQPGHNRAINLPDEKGGIVYIDDFEGSTANLPLSFPFNSWVMSSVPQGDLNLFPESEESSLALGANRARLAWYIADPGARDNSDGINPYTRLLRYQDIFPNRQLTPLEQSALRPFDITIFPRERGPYNFELPNGYPGLSAGLTSTGQLNLPATRWAGIMKGLTNTDFEASNIEFIEFWMLNPYMDKPDDPGSISDAGEMYFDLGAISEDIMRDSRQFFENAIPTSEGSGRTVDTRWGRVPVLPPVVNAFDNDPARRVLQDVGLDGVDDDGERELFADWLAEINNSNLANNVKTAFAEDPSADNFVFFLDPKFQQNNPGLLERYRLFNNTQGNSPVNETQNLNPSATNIPDMEDLNRDNSLNETESYFRYKIRFPRTSEGGQFVIDLNDPQMKELVTDTIRFTRDGQDYIWYRFKLPLDYRERQAIGGIQDFRAIRFMRMIWRGFTERTTFRFATLELGRNQWRRYTQNLATCDVPLNQLPFDINSVSIEANAARQPFNYTIPPGIRREQSVGAFPDVLQNEQALSMTVCDLPFCDARGVFKIINMDLRQFKRLKMFVHAEDRRPQGSGFSPLDSTHLTVFMRIGSDFVNNYYEYELPLYPSQVDRLPANRNSESREYKDEVWRPENRFDFPLQLLTQIKQDRNEEGFSLEQEYEAEDPENPLAKVKVIGNPNLGYVRGIMVGVRNVKLDQEPKCVELWINELRLNGFNEQFAFAGQARVDMKLADLGNVSMAGSYTGIGWGAIEQRVVQRQREEVIQYDISTNLELGKFLPKKWGLRLPFYTSYSNITRNPEFDPYDLDIKLKDKINAEDDPDKRREIRTLAQDVTINRGFNFTNVRKDRVGGKGKVALPWHIENFSFTYAQNRMQRRTPFIINDELTQRKLGMDYAYAPGLKPIQPFKKLVKNDKYLKWLSEFNFNPLPSTIGFNTNIERLVGVTTWRFAGEDPALNTYYNRRMTWDRNYDVGWDITKSLRLNFSANMRSLIDEPLEFNTDGTRVTKEERRDSILTNMRSLGRPKNYAQNAGLAYTLPFKLIPMMDWITMRANVTAGYIWSAQSLKLTNLDAGDYQNLLNARSLGNTIQNSNTRQLNGDFNFENLYNKSKYLAAINRPATKGGNEKGKDKSRGPLPGGFNPDEFAPGPGGAGPGGLGGDRKAAQDRNKRSADGSDGRKDPAAPGDDKPGDKDKGKDKGKGKAADKDKNKNRQPSTAERIALRPLMMVRKARFTYTENYSSVVPGFTPEPRLMGLSEGFTAPGWGFILGLQPTEAWLDRAAANGWMTHRPELVQQVTRNYTQNIDANVTLEPFRDFRIEVTATRQFTRNGTELFKDQDFSLDPNDVDFQHRAIRDMGSFTVSYFAMNTLFNNDIDGLFARFKDNRPIISDRLGVIAGNTGQHNIDQGYAFGYGRIHQEVLAPAFIAAYTNQDPNTVELDLFKARPALNWKLTYNGLTKVGNIGKTFSNIQLTHGYKSTLTVNSYNTDIFYDRANPYVIDELNFNYIARFEIPQVLINEQFTPLLGLSMKTKAGMNFDVDFKRARQLAMSFVDYQLAETRSTSYNVGFGYRMRDVNIPFLTGKKTKKKSSKKKKPDPNAPPPPPSPAGISGQQPNDMNFIFAFEVRDDITVNHRLDQLEEAIPTRGFRTVTLNPAIEYALNRRLKLRLFTDYRRTVPKTSQSFPITTLRSGVTVQFSLN
ncbi:MAG: cell surface protein SprA [Saprospiraceae bacterium]